MLNFRSSVSQSRYNFHGYNFGYKKDTNQNLNSILYVYPQVQHNKLHQSHEITNFYSKFASQTIGRKLNRFFI